MKLPWVSRLAYDLLIDERDRLRKQNDDLVDNYVRVTRARQGLREVPKPVQGPKNQKPEPIPAVLMEIVNGFHSPAVKKAMEDEVRGMRLAGARWEDILTVLERQIGDGDEAESQAN